MKKFFILVFSSLSVLLPAQKNAAADFNKIRRSYKITDFENFIKKYPKSSFVSIAQRKIDSLKEIYTFYDAIASTDTLVLQQTMSMLTRDSLKNELKEYVLMWRTWTYHKFFRDPSFLKSLYKIPVTGLMSTYGDTAYFIVINAMLDKINSIRKQHGLSKLEMDYKLAFEARRHAEEMCRRNFFAHIDPIRGNPHVRAFRANFSGSMVGENIAGGQTTIESLFKSWMASKGHRANILNPKFNRVGVGFVLCDNPRSNFPSYYVNLFGRVP